MAIYDNVFINGNGDAIHIQPHNDIPRDMAIFSNTVLASGTGIQVRRAEGTAYRQRVIANVVAASTPVKGGEADYNLTLAYRADLLNVAPAELTLLLLRHGQAAPRLPEELARELAAYPDWQRATLGARIAPAMLRTLDSPP
ncbi:MAG TPA: hypothetical protein VF501_11290 [Thiobacillus sp.]